MREFKFRIWDDVAKEFIYQHAAMFLRIEDGTPVYYKKLVRPSHNIEVHNEWPAHLVLQQFTGLVDEEDRDIYEGDILRVKAGKLTIQGKVEYVVDCFQIKMMVEGMTINSALRDRAYRSKVIGNIFEGVYAIHVQ